MHTRYAPVRHSHNPSLGYLPFDLHVLGLPLAFILSQDQTLLCSMLYLLFFVLPTGYASDLSLSHINLTGCIISYIFLTPFRLLDSLLSKNFAKLFNRVFNIPASPFCECKGTHFFLTLYTNDKLFFYLFFLRLSIRMLHDEIF